VEESDLEPHEITGDGIVFKDSDAWKTQFAMVKEVLATRPNTGKNNSDK